MRTRFALLLVSMIVSLAACAGMNSLKGQIVDDGAIVYPWGPGQSLRIDLAGHKNGRHVGDGTDSWYGRFSMDSFDADGWQGTITSAMAWSMSYPEYYKDGIIVKESDTSVGDPPLVFKSAVVNRRGKTFVDYYIKTEYGSTVWVSFQTDEGPADMIKAKADSALSAKIVPLKTK